MIIKSHYRRIFWEEGGGHGRILWEEGGGAWEDFLGGGGLGR